MGKQRVLCMFKTMFAKIGVDQVCGTQPYQDHGNDLNNEPGAIIMDEAAEDPPSPDAGDDAFDDAFEGAPDDAPDNASDIAPDGAPDDAPNYALRGGTPDDAPDNASDGAPDSARDEASVDATSAAGTDDEWEDSQVLSGWLGKAYNRENKRMAREHVASDCEEVPSSATLELGNCGSEDESLGFTLALSHACGTFSSFSVFCVSRASKPRAGEADSKSDSDCGSLALGDLDLSNDGKNLLTYIKTTCPEFMALRYGVLAHVFCVSLLLCATGFRKF